MNARDGNDCPLSCDSPASRRLTGVVLRENNTDSFTRQLKIHSRTDSEFYKAECLFAMPEARSFSQEKERNHVPLYYYQFEEKIDIFNNKHSLSYANLNTRN